MGEAAELGRTNNTSPFALEACDVLKRLVVRGLNADTMARARVRRTRDGTSRCWPALSDE